MYKMSKFFQYGARQRDEVASSRSPSPAPSSSSRSPSPAPSSDGGRTSPAPVRGARVSEVRAAALAGIEKKREAAAAAAAAAAATKREGMAKRTAASGAAEAPPAARGGGAARGRLVASGATSRATSPATSESDDDGMPVAMKIKPKAAAASLDKRLATAKKSAGTAAAAASVGRRSAAGTGGDGAAVSAGRRAAGGTGAAAAAAAAPAAAAGAAGASGKRAYILDDDDFKNGPTKGKAHEIFADNFAVRKNSNYIHVRKIFRDTLTTALRTHGPLTQTEADTVVRPFVRLFELTVQSAAAHPTAVSSTDGVQEDLFNGAADLFVRAADKDVAQFDKIALASYMVLARHLGEITESDVALLPLVAPWKPHFIEGKIVGKLARLAGGGRAGRADVSILNNPIKIPAREYRRSDSDLGAVVLASGEAMRMAVQTVIDTLIKDGAIEVIARTPVDKRPLAPVYVFKTDEAAAFLALTVTAGKHNSEQAGEDAAKMEAAEAAAATATAAAVAAARATGLDEEAAAAAVPGAAAIRGTEFVAGYWTSVARATETITENIVGKIPAGSLIFTGSSPSKEIAARLRIGSEPGAGPAESMRHKNLNDFMGDSALAHYKATKTPKKGSEPPSEARVAMATEVLRARTSNLAFLISAQGAVAVKNHGAAKACFKKLPDMTKS
jgi:hypothetical protein